MEQVSAEKSVRFKMGTMDSTVIQLIKYGAIGFATNSAGYLLYLIITYIGIPPVVAMTLLYALGATIGFFGNRKLTFSYEGSVIGSGIRYILTHLAGYALNLAILVIFVDRLGYPHKIVQAIAILCIAAFLFIMFKVFVFRSTRNEL